MEETKTIRMAVLPLWIMQMQDVSSTSKLLLERFVVVSDYGKKKFPVYLEGYANTFGMSWMTIKRSIQKLLDLGFIKQETASESWDKRFYYSVTDKVFTTHSQE